MKKQSNASIQIPQKPQKGFSYSRAFFEDLVDSAIAHAKKLGATDAAAEASEGAGLSVSVRKGTLENVEHNRDKSLGITVYIGSQRGNASTSDFSPEAVQRTAQAAFDIARFTAQDPFSALPEAQYITQNKVPDLDIFHPWTMRSEQATQLALRCEAAALQFHKTITNTEGASVSAQQSHFFHAQTNGFRGGFASSRHSMGVVPIAKYKGEMQRDYWYSSKRSAADLPKPERIGEHAAQRAISRLGARKIKTTECPVLFESQLAAGLLGCFLSAISGGALYRKSSFLLDSLGKLVFPQNICIEEDPFIKRGMGSSPFDAEGVQVKARTLVNDGHVQGYLLNSYTARKLGMKPTGNAGGSHNVHMYSSASRAYDTLEAMLQKLGTGLFVIELMGQGINMVTGDYSRGASGFWVENGEIAYPVQEITIAGNLTEMFQGIEAIGADTYTYGARTTGSVLINRMKIAGG